MILAEVKDRAGQQEGRGSPSEGEGPTAAPPPLPHPTAEASCPLLLALEGPRTQDLLSCFPLFP